MFIFVNVNIIFGNTEKVYYLSQFSGLSEDDVKIILEQVKKLKENEKKVLEEFKEERKYYYLGYLPITYKVRVNV